MGCHTEPAAVHIVHVLQRLHFFQFFIFLIIYTTYRKKKLHAFTAKKKIQFFFVIYTTYRKKKLHAFKAKKNYTTRRFFRTRLTFFTVGPSQLRSMYLGGLGRGLDFNLPQMTEKPA